MLIYEGYVLHVHVHSSAINEQITLRYLQLWPTITSRQTEWRLRLNCIAFTWIF